MDDVVASTDGIAPARVTSKFSRGEGECGIVRTGGSHHCADLLLARLRSNRRPDDMSGLEQLQHDMTADKSGTAGHEGGWQCLRV